MLYVYIFFASLVLFSKSQILKPGPSFSQSTIKKAENIILYDNIPLNTEILVAQAFTHEEANPIVYSLIDKDEFFRINSTSGSIRLFASFEKQRKYQFKIVATDSASKKQSTYLTANIVVISANTQIASFNDEIGHHVTIFEIITPGSVIYNQIYLKDFNSDQNGVPRIYCDNSDSSNSDAFQSCNYFKVDFQIKDTGVYQCYVTLIKKLDYSTKKSFVVSITAEILMKKMTTYLLIELKSGDLRPKFSQPVYPFIISFKVLSAKSLEIKVLNVDLDKFKDNHFILTDPRNLFKLSNYSCSDRICYQSVELKKSVPFRKNYKMNITFNQQNEKNIFSTQAEIHAIFDYPQLAQKPPVFLLQEHIFYIYENISADATIRNASIAVYEDEPLSTYNSGFYLEIFDDENSFVKDTFEIEPNFGMGFLVSFLKLKPNKQLDHETGPNIFNFKIRAISRSNESLFSYTNVRLFIQDSNEHSPYFNDLVVNKVLNNPENLNPGDYIATIKANDEDSTDKQNGLVYNLIGAHQHKFTIDSLGQLRLFKKFDFQKEPFELYNITIIAYDQGGLSNYTHLILYFNITSPWAIDKSDFFCSISCARSELNLIDFKTLQPELYIPVNSPKKLKYFVSDSEPKLDELEIDSFTGRIFFNSPINSTTLKKYSRMVIKIKAYQVQKELNDSLYFSSVTCMAIIYFKNLKQPYIYDQKPIFLRNYDIQIEKELVGNLMPLFKIEAISMNPKNNLPIKYTLIKNSELFYIDTFQGFVYLKDNLSLEIKVYELTVEATDQSNGLCSSLNVFISIIQRKSKRKLKCSQDYVLVKIDPEKFSNQNSITQINCSAEIPSLNSKITYDISSVHKIYNCEGFEVSFEPSIGIDSSTGKIVPFKKLNRNDFCDASFTIYVHQDDVSITIPFKLILIRESTLKPPEFIQNSINITNLSEYAHIGSYITTVIAFDPVSLQLIEKYSIISEDSYPRLFDRYFKIDSLTGVISLNNLPFVQNVKLNVSATSSSGISSYASVFIDLSSYFANFFSNLYLDSNYIYDNVTLYTNKFYYDSIYKVSPRCFSRYDLSNHVPCNRVEYSIDFIRDNQTDNLFLIDNQTGNLYLSSSEINNNIRNEYVLIVNAKNELAIRKDRFIRNDQRQLKVFIKSSEIPIFDKNNYTINLFTDILNNSIILTLKYKSISRQIFNIFMAQKSNNLIENYFFLKYIPLFNQIQLLVKNPPILFETNRVNFEIWLTNSEKLLNRVFININIYHNTAKSNYLIFTSPSKAGYVLNLDPSLMAIVNNTVIFDFDVINRGNKITFTILNKNPIPFYLDNKSLRIIFPFPEFIDPNKKSYLLFVEAKNEKFDKNYITIDIRVNLLVDNLPRFEREKTSGPLFLSVYENAQLFQSILDLKKLVRIPGEKYFFYVYDAETNELSETFNVNMSGEFWLQPIKKLNSRLKNIYRLFIFVTDLPTNSQHFYNPSFLNRALLFVNIKILDSVHAISYFSQYTKFITLDPIVFVDKKIGLVKAVSNEDKPIYKFIACDLVFNSLTYVDPQFCQLFILDKENGIISTNSSNYQTFINNYFVLKIAAFFSKALINIEVYVFIVDKSYKSQLVFSDVNFKPSLSLNLLKNDINIILDKELNGTLRFEYTEFSFPFQTTLYQGLNTCFVLIEKNDKRILDFEESKNIFSKSDMLKKLLLSYSISEINKCTDENNLLLNKKFYQKNGLWNLDSFSIGMIALSSLILLASIFSICLLQLCWASLLRQSTLAFLIDSDSIDANSNNFLIDE